MTIKIKRDQQDNLSIAFHADSDQERRDLKDAVLAAVNQGFSLETLIDQLEKRAYGEEHE